MGGGAQGAHIPLLRVSIADRNNLDRNKDEKSSRGSKKRLEAQRNQRL